MSRPHESLTLTQARDAILEWGRGDAKLIASRCAKAEQLCRQPGDCTFTLKEVLEMGWLPPGSRAKLEAVRYAAGDLLSSFVSSGGVVAGYESYDLAPRGPQERLTKALEDAGSVPPLNPERDASGATGKGRRPGVGAADSQPSTTEEEYARRVCERHMGAQ